MNLLGIHLSLSIICVEFSFKPVDLTMVMKVFKFMENFNSWKMYLQVKIMTLDIFTYMLWPLSLFPYSPCSQNSPPGSFITPQVTMTWSIRLFIFYFMWFVIFSNVMKYQIKKTTLMTGGFLLADSMLEVYHKREIEKS